MDSINNTYYALLGTLFTWGVTALGASLVFFFPSNLKEKDEVMILDISLGFSAGVMLAASYFSLLEPSVELAIESKVYGDYYFFPTSFGFLLGGFFVMIADKFIPDVSIEKEFGLKDHSDSEESNNEEEESKSSGNDSISNGSDKTKNESNKQSLRKRNTRSNINDKTSMSSAKEEDEDVEESAQTLATKRKNKAMSIRRIFLLVAAVTIHNFPEGMAVGVGFGAIGKSPHATFEAAKLLAFGIGIQNFPEGLAVSLPMRRLGYSKMKCFFYGQLSGMVEPIAGVLGAYGVSIAEPILPYALSFAAGAMVFVVCDSIIPETHRNRSLASISVMVGFVIMMSLDLFL